MPESLKLNISPAVIDWALRYAKSDEIEKKLLSWKSGEKKPTAKQVEKISKKLHLPFAGFLFSEPFAENIPLLEYRTIKTLEIGEPSRELIDTIQNMTNIQDWMREYLLNVFAEKLSFVGCLKDEKNVMNIADKIRRVLKINLNWQKDIFKNVFPFKFFREHLESIGVIVMLNGVVGTNPHRALDNSEFRAFTLIDDYAPLVFINSNDSESGKLFSLLHETVHIFLGNNSLFNADDKQNTTNPIEKLCNAVAAEILVPKILFDVAWKKDIDSIEQIKTLGKEFRCSIVVIARRALDFGLIDMDLYNIIAETARKQYLSYKEKQKQQEGGGNHYNTLKSRINERFLLTLDDAIWEGRATYTDAFKLTNTNSKTYDELIRKVRGDTYIQ